jgi:hypothetical protein
MATKTSQTGKRLGRPPLGNTSKRTTLPLSDDDLVLIHALQTHFGQKFPGLTFSDQQLLRLLVMKGLDAFEREAAHPQPTPSEPSTIKV